MGQGVTCLRRLLRRLIRARVAGVLVFVDRFTGSGDPGDGVASQASLIVQVISCCWYPGWSIPSSLPSFPLAPPKRCPCGRSAVEAGLNRSRFVRVWRGHPGQASLA